MINNIYRSAVPAPKYLPERRSAAFRHHYSPGRKGIEEKGREGEEKEEGREGRRGGRGKERNGEGCVMAFGGMDAPVHCHCLVFL